jgi:hypothetical protein
VCVPPRGSQTHGLVGCGGHQGSVLTRRPSSHNEHSDSRHVLGLRGVPSTSQCRNRENHPSTGDDSLRRCFPTTTARNRPTNRTLRRNSSLSSIPEYGGRSHTARSWWLSALDVLGFSQEADCLLDTSRTVDPPVCSRGSSRTGFHRFDTLLFLYYPSSFRCFFQRSGCSYRSTFAVTWDRRTPHRSQHRYGLGATHRVLSSDVDVARFRCEPIYCTSGSP